MYLAAIIFTIRSGGAKIPECPSGLRRSVRDIASSCLQEVDLVDRAVVSGTGEQDEEDEENCAGSEKEREESESGSWKQFVNSGTAEKLGHNGLTACCHGGKSFR